MNIKQKLALGMLITGAIGAALALTYSVAQLNNEKHQWRKAAEYYKQQAEVADSLLMKDCRFEGFECPHVQLHNKEISNGLQAIKVCLKGESNTIGTIDEEGAFDLTPHEFWWRYNIKFDTCTLNHSLGR